MSAKSTFSILFWIYNKDEVNNQGIVYARITVDGKRSNISLKRKVDILRWDKKLQRLNGTTEEVKSFNQFLSSIYTQIFQIYQDLRLKGELITTELIKAHYLGETDEQKTLRGLLNYHNAKIEVTLSKGTIKNFHVTEKYIGYYLRDIHKTSDVYLKQLNYRFLMEFEQYLHNFWPKGHPKSMSHNTVMKHIQRFRKIATLGYHMEWMSKDPFIRWKPKWERREREFLSPDELARLESKKLYLERLDRVRDLFVFSCYTGISYVDVMQLNSKSIGKGVDNEDWILIKRQKTDIPVKVPLLDKALEIIKKYRGHPIIQVSGTLLPVITNEKLNLYLKEVAELCEIDKNLTFHMARHTFATTVTLSNGVPIETVSKLLGHNKISTTQIYSRVVETKISQDMDELKNVLNIKANQKAHKNSREFGMRIV
ncbi:site-specific integrase [Pseudotamlana agarivorans]|uniref:site-specific integrase n=1 Tax=Pseudotamlana agarivorans TaxID=481183 RepID=UPI00082F952F|nr:site-specific integrase [Tamlana agarivorans]